MGVNEGNIATAALVIAISAFVIACGQLLQQLFSTADGLRRCQESVIGGWSQLVQLRFRWSSCRFEVRVTTPHFEIAQFALRGLIGPAEQSYRQEGPLTIQEAIRQLRSLYKYDAATPLNLVGTDHAYRWSMFPVKGEISTEETVTWLPLIADIHRLQYQQLRDPFRDNYPMLQQTNGEALHRVMLLSLTRRTRSWDFMPPDVVRPVASTTLGCIVCMVHRMDMVWVEFRPDEGIIRARGTGRSFAASRVRGLGLVMEYDSNGQFAFGNYLRVPSSDSDKMACGILPGFRRMYLDNGVRYSAVGDLLLRVGNQPMMTQLSWAFNVLKLNSDAISSLNRSVIEGSGSNVLPGLADLLGLWTEWIPLPSHFMDVVENPFPVKVTPMGSRFEARVVWRWLLRTHCNTHSDHMKRILEIYDEWEMSEPERFYTQYEVLGNSSSDHEMKSHFRTIFYETKSYFDRFHSDFYETLVQTHVAVNSHSLKQAGHNIFNGRNQPHPVITRPDIVYQGDPVFTERAFVYVENLPKICDAIDPTKYAHITDSSSIPCIEEAWWMAMLRMQAWNMGVKIVQREGLTVPYHYYGDPSRVYIL